MTAPTAPRAADADAGVPPRRGPVDLPGPEGDNSIAREPLWYAYGAGDDAPEAPPWSWVPQPPPDTHVPPPPPRGGGPRRALPLGTHDRLAALPYPAPPPRGVPGPGAAEPVGDRLGRALVTAFGPQRREPENPYNDHRPYASPRCLFPVHAFVDGGAGMPWRLLEPDRHALTGTPAGPVGNVLLTGRYTTVPPAYQWFRGSLIAIELGFVLRALTLGLELFDVPARLRLPGPDAHALLPALGLDDAWAWSLPFVVELDDGGGARADGGGGVPVDGGGGASAGEAGPVPAPPARLARTDPALAELIRVNREQTYDSAPAPLTTAVPAGLGPSATVPDWAELLWRRHSGRMPRALHGMSGRRRDVPAEALDSAARWLSVPPPGPELTAAFEAMTVTAVVRGVEGRADGVHRLRDGAARLLRADATAPERLEEQYGYGVSPVNGCGIRHAPLTVFLSVRTRELFERLGTAGWGAVQHAAGWAAHGLCLSAAASGLFARPVRAFKEIPTQRVLGLDPDEMIVLSVVVGVPQDTGGALLDLRL
ncbi:nitroreductase family protein [Streptomyces sp. NPDC013489]|uniref:nitroreductase family protein n=1 Tax=Streptomyces sp. NPDC013489 TaxID=3155606 RepID=UPI0033CEA6B7